MMQYCRDACDTVLDYFRFRLDTLPSLDYQPLPWLGLSKARRSGGVESRCKVIVDVVQQANAVTALDIGCNAGYFSLSLAKIGMTVLGVDHLARNQRLFLYAIRKLRHHNVGALYLKVSPETVHILPEVDCILFLSVWHHLTREYGLDAGSAMLRTLWDKTKQVLFFETGELEMPADYNLPALAPDPRESLHRFLEANCPGCEIQHLGMHDAFAPDGKPTQRNLFAVFRKRQT